jgi:hypothetical protein
MCAVIWNGVFKLAPHAGFLAAKHFSNLHRSKIPNLDPYITLAWQRLQAAVTMAMQVGPTLAHTIFPQSEHS